MKRSNFSGPLGSEAEGNIDSCLKMCSFYLHVLETFIVNAEATSRKAEL